MRTSGPLLCLASAAAFGAMAPFGKLAYGAGATVGTLLSVRFALAAVLLWSLVLSRGRRGMPATRRPSRRDVLLALALGACGYAVQAGCFFAALSRIDASLLSLLVYTFPVLVAVAAIALHRERAERRRLLALAGASAGLLLVLAGAGGAGTVDPLGVGLGLAAAATYATYILVSEPVARRVDPRTFAALVCTGAAATLVPGAALLGDLRPGELTAQGWGWLAAIAIVCTVAAIGLFFAGLPRTGATSAAILATLEPLITVVLACLIFGERLAGPQLAGGAGLLAAVLVLTAAPAPRRRTNPREVAPCPQ